MTEVSTKARGVRPPWLMILLLLPAAFGLALLINQFQPQPYTSLQLQHVQSVRQDMAKGVEPGTILLLRSGGFALVTHTEGTRTLYASAVRSDPSITHMSIDTIDSAWFLEITAIVRPTDSAYAVVRDEVLPTKTKKMR